MMYDRMSTERYGSDDQTVIFGETSEAASGEIKVGPGGLQRSREIMEMHEEGHRIEHERIARENERRFPVIEIFGPTIQGEGPLIGAPCYFVRFGGCDYRCSWCDSKYAVDPDQVRANSTHMTAHEIAREIGQLAGGAEWVILSGGNPALHKLEPLTRALHERHYKLQVETQGTIWRPWLIDVERVVVSPKPPSSGMRPESEDEQNKAVAQLDQFVDSCRRGTVAAKIVVFDETDYRWATGCLNWLWDTRGVPGFLSVGNNVGVDDTTSLLKRYEWLCERVLHDPRVGHVRVLPQMHVLLWGNARGV